MLRRCLPRLPAPSSHPTEPGAKLEQNTQRIQFTNRNKHLFSRFYIITKQNQGRQKNPPTTQHFLCRLCAAVTLYFLEEITLLRGDVWHWDPGRHLNLPVSRGAGGVAAVSHLGRLPGSMAALSPGTPAPCPPTKAVPRGLPTAEAPNFTERAKMNQI